MQFDEKWGFGAKDEANRDREGSTDSREGVTRVRVEIDTVGRPIPRELPGERTAEDDVVIVGDVRHLTGGRLMVPKTADGNPSGERAFRAAS